MKYYKNLSINESDFSVQKQGRCIVFTEIIPPISFQKLQVLLV